MTTITKTESASEIRFKISSSPHMHSNVSTQKAMWLVNLALLPSLISGIVFFGYYQLALILVSVVTCVVVETTIQKIRKIELTYADGSAILTGLLLALILPPSFSLISTALGAIVAIGVGKQVFGGLGFNIFNPALVGRAFLQAAFPVPMTTWTKSNYSIDAVTSATPLSAFKFDKIAASLDSLFIGNIGGSLGETSGAAILLGGIFLIITKIINWRIPISMIIGALIFGGLFYLIDPLIYPTPFFHIGAGGFLFGAFFMATDWVTSPITNKGVWIFGLGIALLIVVIRLFGGLPEGVMYSILFMNALVPLINKFTRPKIFGAEK